MLIADAISEIDLLNLARSCQQSISTDFSQTITITFAMVVATYYFLHQAGIRMKIFAFLIYTCGMLAFLGRMLVESGVALGAIQSLQALPEVARSLPTQMYLGVRASPVGTVATLMLNLVFWVLWIGVGYLLFFWRKPTDLPFPHR